MNFNAQEYHDKVLGCWLGKSIGGTIGAPMEWKRQVNNVTFYTQNLTGDPVPNDDLDIQLLWLVALEEQGPRIDGHVLADYWLTYVTPHWAEYGTCKANLRIGLAPPLSGTYGNDYKDSCGAFIRSEIWACICPGNPQLAARYAYEDAIIDHGNGEGMYAEVFCAALEAAAFVCKDIAKLIDIGLSYIPKDCGVAKAIYLAQECHRSGKTWLEARHLMLEKHRGKLAGWAHVSDEDRKRGFDTGKLGYDVPSNIGMLLIGLFYGEGDFDKTMCTAINCGEDTDCTGATVGSIFGILYGAKAIPERWIKPIGRGIKTACLNLGELGFLGSQLPDTVDNLTDRTLAMARRVSAERNLGLAYTDQPTDKVATFDHLYAGRMLEAFYLSTHGPRFTHHQFEVAVNYGEDGPVILPGQPKTISLRMANLGKYQTMLQLKFHLPEGLTMTGSTEYAHLCLQPQFGQPNFIPFTFRADQIKTPTLRATIEFTQPGRASTFHVPIVLLCAPGR
jgi:ADP-ribosylglycohydrolase